MLSRTYDDPRSIGDNSHVILPVRFFTWNSSLKSVQSSLDCYFPANRASLRTRIR
jgi:hypothetical protein